MPFEIITSLNITVIIINTGVEGV